jgi:hypothetical protein
MGKQCFGHLPIVAHGNVKKESCCHDGRRFLGCSEKEASPFGSLVWPTSMRFLFPLQYSRNREREKGPSSCVLCDIHLVKEHSISDQFIASKPFILMNRPMHRERRRRLLQKMTPEMTVSRLRRGSPGTTKASWPWTAVRTWAKGLAVLCSDATGAVRMQSSRLSLSVIWARYVCFWRSTQL